MECVSLWKNLLSLYFSSLLNSFLHEAKVPHLAARPRDSPEAPGCDRPLTPHLFFLLSCKPKCLLLLKSLRADNQSRSSHYKRRQVHHHHMSSFNLRHWTDFLFSSTFTALLRYNLHPTELRYVIQVYNSHTVKHLFQVHNSMIFSIFTGSLPWPQFNLEYFYHLQKKPHTP